MDVIASGRASEIADLGDGRVLRRFKAGGNPAREAAVMEHARAHGFPVPDVLEVLDDALILERIDGPTMLTDLRRRPWRALRSARTLAQLHSRLHEIPLRRRRGTRFRMPLHFDSPTRTSRTQSGHAHGGCYVDQCRLST